MSDFVVTDSCLFLLLITENYSHVLKGYCCTRYKKKKVSAEQLINWACLLHCTQSQTDRAIIIIQGCLFFLHGESWQVGWAGGFTERGPGWQEMLSRQRGTGSRQDEVYSVRQSSETPRWLKVDTSRWADCAEDAWQGRGKQTHYDVGSKKSSRLWFIFVFQGHTQKIMMESYFENIKK